jgi:hypothetical protein
LLAGRRHGRASPAIRAASWYESYGSLPLLDAPLWLVLPLAKGADALERDL